MKIKIFGKNIEVTEGIRSAVEEKIGKLDKYFAEETRVDVTLSVNKNEQKVEVTIPVKGRIIRAEEISDDMYVSIDMVEETIERQLVKYKNKIIDKKKSIKLLQRHTLKLITKTKMRIRLKSKRLRDLVLSQWILKKLA